MKSLFEKKLRAGRTSCYTWGDFIAGTRSDSLVPYSRESDDEDLTWQESINETRWTDNPQLSVRCHRFASKSNAFYFIRLTTQGRISEREGPVRKKMVWLTHTAGSK